MPFKTAGQLGLGIPAGFPKAGCHSSAKVEKNMRAATGKILI